MLTVELPEQIIEVSGETARFNRGCAQTTGVGSEAVAGQLEPVVATTRNVPPA